MLDLSARRRADRVPRALVVWRSSEWSLFVQGVLGAVAEKISKLNSGEEVITRLAYQRQLIAGNALPNSVRSDVVQVGEDTNGNVGLFLHDLQFPTGNTADFTVFLEESDDGLNWTDPSSKGVYTAATTVLQQFQFTPKASLIRFLFSLNPALTGTDKEVAIVTYTMDLRLYRV